MNDVCDVVGVWGAVAVGSGLFWELDVRYGLRALECLSGLKLHTIPRC